MKSTHLVCLAIKLEHRRRCCCGGCAVVVLRIARNVMAVRNAINKVVRQTIRRHLTTRTKTNARHGKYRNASSNFLRQPRDSCMYMKIAWRQIIWVGEFLFCSAQMHAPLAVLCSTHRMRLTRLMIVRACSFRPRTPDFSLII